MCNQEYIQNLCSNIRILRQRERLTLSDMAARLGIPEKDVALLEKGSLPEGLEVEALIRLEKEFNISLKEIFLPFNG